MLRLLLLLLIVANMVFFGWSQGWLDGLVGAPRPEREPQRLAAQVRPELVQILTAAASAPAPDGAPASASMVTPAASASTVAAAGSAAVAPGAAPAASPVPAGLAAAASAASSPGAPASAAGQTANARAPGAAPAASVAVAAAPAAPASAPVCLEAGPYTPAEVASAEAALKPLLAGGAWNQRRATSGGEWMIYMGPYPDREAIDRKRAELSRIRGGVPQEELTSPPELARGLALGRFASPAAANATLAQYRLRGIRTARVVQSASGAPVVYLRVPQADPTVAAQLAALKATAGRSFSPCPR